MLTKARFITITIVLAFLLGLQACAQKATPQENCNFIVNSQKQRVSWDYAAPAVLYIDPSVQPQYFGAIQNAAQVWNRQIGREVIRIGGVLTQASSANRDGRNIIYWSNTWESTRRNEQARTNVAWVGDQMAETDVKINDQDYNFSTADQPMRGYVDLESLLVHEFGHVLGLMHIYEKSSVMAEALPDAHLRRQPSDLDIT